MYTIIIMGITSELIYGLCKNERVHPFIAFRSGGKCHF